MKKFSGATRLDRWGCPLCDRVGAALDARAAAIEHGLDEHPATYPAVMTTAQRLAWLPMLAAEVRATSGHPNPTDRSAPGGYQDGSGRVPADLAALCALEPGDTPRVAYGDPAEVLFRCSRIVWEALDSGLKASHPQPLVTPTVESESAWLAGVWSDAQAVLDLVDIERIESDVAEVCMTLARATRMRPTPSVPCLVDGCQGSVPALGETPEGWLWADVCVNNHPVDRHAIARRWADLRLVTLTEASGLVGVPVRTLRYWSTVGVLTAESRRGNAALFELGMVRRAASRIRRRRTA
ncbi:hypothetical protein GCM10009785_01400 [Brooklawnia cerclae]|uniref:MerR family transcriptional regulator n=1 Tax=Brooklawnia cerclae TaxID=349934 RepID=A0ABX0SGC9_9ACTN|nr:hypothetical protein [Brooklawnia cerclae]NIH56265.1 hypothetical protein [Brooklawnia cerclae]